MAKRRRFTPEFKAELVLEVLSGGSSQAEVCRRHNLNENQLSQWKRHLLENASALFESTNKRSSEVLRVAYRPSCARRGRPWENGYAKRLIRTLKEQEVYINDYQDVTEARDRIGHFITQVSHQKRPHSALGYLTPMEFQRKTLS